jgi:hypothetical protein
MVLADRHRDVAEAALSGARRNPVMSTEQWFRTGEIHALLAIEARLAQIVDHHAARPDLVASR